MKREGKFIQTASQFPWKQPPLFDLFFILSLPKLSSFTLPWNSYTVLCMLEDLGYCGQHWFQDLLLPGLGERNHAGVELSVFIRSSKDPQVRHEQRPQCRVKRCPLGIHLCQPVAGGPENSVHQEVCHHTDAKLLCKVFVVAVSYFQVAICVPAVAHFSYGALLLAQGRPARHQSKLSHQSILLVLPQAGVLFKRKHWLHNHNFFFDLGGFGFPVFLLFQFFGRFPRDFLLLRCLC